jgi:hypothetical protein
LLLTDPTKSYKKELPVIYSPAEIAFSNSAAVFFWPPKRIQPVGIFKLPIKTYKQKWGALLAPLF